MTRLLLVRHGQSTWNADGRWQGQADPPLSPLGRDQALTAAQRVGTVDVVLASDLQRAVETASAMLDYGALGDLEAQIACAFVADAVGRTTGRA